MNNNDKTKTEIDNEAAKDVNGGVIRIGYDGNVVGRRLYDAAREWDMNNAVAEVVFPEQKAVKVDPKVRIGNND